MKEAAKETKKAAKEAKEGAKEIKKLIIAVRRNGDRKRKSEEEIDASELKVNVARTSETQVENEIAPQQWRVPVARM